MPKSIKNRSKKLDIGLIARATVETLIMLFTVSSIIFAGVVSTGLI